MTHKSKIWDFWSWFDGDLKGEVFYAFPVGLRLVEFFFSSSGQETGAFDSHLPDQPPKKSDLALCEDVRWESVLRSTHIEIG